MTTPWSPEQLRRIDASEELHIAVRRREDDGGLSCRHDAVAAAGVMTFGYQ